MKTGQLAICIASLLFTACGKQAGDPNTNTTYPDTPKGARSGFLLTTDLPEARFEGTQPPVRLPMRTPMPGA